MDILSQLFGSTVRVKMMRLFLFNPTAVFDIEYIKGKTDAKPREIEKELAFFKRIGLVKKNKKTKGWSHDPKFQFTDALTEFLTRTHSLEYKTIVKRLEKTGRIKVVFVSGVFMRNNESRLDLFVVGDNIRTPSFNRVIKGIESDMGKDIRYAVLSAEEFSYRMSMNDKLVRDVLDFSHTILVDKLGVSKPQ